MASSRFSLSRIAGVLVGALLVAALPAVPASADTAPPSGVLPTVSTDIMAAPQIDKEAVYDPTVGKTTKGGVIWSQAIIGDTVYAGGNFSSARPALAPRGERTSPRWNLLSWNINSGVLTNFAPRFNGQVRAVAGSPDGSRLYVAGDFTTVNGEAHRGVAAFDTATSKLISSFNPAVNSRVYSVAATDSTVFIGGSFTTVDGASRKRVAALTTTGAVKSFSADVADYIVRAIVVAPDRGSILIGGSFTKVNGTGTPGYGLARLNSGTGGTIALPINENVRDGGAKSAITSLASDGDSFYGTGYIFGGGGNLEGSFRGTWSTGRLAWVSDCHGDSYGIAPMGSAVYVVSHAHFCGNIGGQPEQDAAGTSQPIMQRAMAFTKAAERTVTADSQGYASWAGKPGPSILNWYPTIGTGQGTGQGQGAWNVVANDRYVVLAGEFLAVNNKLQQGIVRYAVRSLAPNKDYPRLYGASYVPTVESISAGSMLVRWPANYDRDNEKLTYRLLRNGSVIHTATETSRIWFDRPWMNFVDTAVTKGQSYTYSVRVTDPMGNSVDGAGVTVTATSTYSLTAYKRRVLNDDAAHFWRLGESSGGAQDAAGTRNGTPYNEPGRNVPGAVAGDPSTATWFNGSNYFSTASSSQAPPQVAVEAWFNTTNTASGGTIVNFGNAKTGNSSAYDRDLYLDAAGRISFGSNSWGDRRVQSGPGYNNGQWHHVVGTLSPYGMKLVVDGRQVAERRDVVNGRSFRGYWRIGGDASRLGAGYFKGSVDEVAVYDRALTVPEIYAHYELGRGASGAAAADAAAPTDQRLQETSDVLPEQTVPEVAPAPAEVLEPEVAPEVVAPELLAPEEIGATEPEPVSPELVTPEDFAR